MELNERHFRAANGVCLTREKAEKLFRYNNGIQLQTWIQPIPYSFQLELIRHAQQPRAYILLLRSATSILPLISDASPRVRRK